MGTKIIKYIVRDVPHPKYPQGTIVFHLAIYELPNGERRDLLTDELKGTVTPPTNRNNYTRVPSYAPGM